MRPDVDDLIKQTQWKITHNAGHMAWKAGLVRDLSDNMKRATEALDTEEMQRYSGRLVEMARSLESDRRALMWEMKLNETLIEIAKVHD